MIIKQFLNGIEVDGTFQEGVIIDTKKHTDEKEWPLGTELHAFGHRWYYVKAGKDINIKELDV